MARLLLKMKYVCFAYEYLMRHCYTLKNRLVLSSPGLCVCSHGKGNFGGLILASGERPSHLFRCFCVVHSLGSLLDFMYWLPAGKILNLSFFLFCSVGLLSRQSPSLNRLAARRKTDFYTLYAICLPFCRIFGYFQASRQLCNCWLIFLRDDSLSTQNFTYMVETCFSGSVF